MLRALFTTLVMLRCLSLVALALFAMQASARTYSVSPANPVALELVHLQVGLNSCEGVRGVEAIDGGFRINIQTPTTGLPCDDLGFTSFTLGAFPPGTYRLTTRITCIDCTPSVFDEPGVTTFTVTAATASTAPFDDRPSVDLSGIWTTPSEPFTGFTFMQARGFDAQGRPDSSLTGIWYDYSGTQPTWTLLLSGQGSSQVFRAVPSGTGTNRTIALVAVGTARIVSRAPMGGFENWHLVGTIDGREFDYPLERFRWTRAAWPAPRS